MLEVKEILNTSEWEEFLLETQKFTVFVQSPQYGEFYALLKEESHIFGVYEDETLIGGSLVVTTHAKRGDFFYLPYGPIQISGKEETVLTALVAFLKKEAKKQGMAFIRISPFCDDSEETKNIFKKVGGMEAPMHVLAETTWILDITPDENTLLAHMNKNHRNLIRRCQKEGVRVEISYHKEDLTEFNELLDITSKRHNFFRFSKKYVENEFSAYAPRQEAAIFRAYLPDGRLDSSAIIFFYGNMAAYRHGASLGLDNKVPTSYLLQWNAIQEAKKRGLLWYNFWGIAPDGANKNHPFSGITHFKKGFGGFKKDLLHCQDIPVSSWYWINWIIETCRRIKRGF